MKISKLMKLLVIAAVILGLSASMMHAQAGRGQGRLKILVVDDANNKMADVHVKIIFKTSGLEYEAKTNNKGEHTFGMLGGGMWQIIASHPGYVPDKKQMKVLQHSKNPVVKMRLVKAEKMAVVPEEANLVDKGNAFFSEGKYEEAMAAFQEFLTKTPDLYEIKINIANCLLKMEKYDEAEAAYNKFLTDHADAKLELRAQCLSSIGTIYMKKEDMTKAQEYFMKSIELNPKDEILAYNVGEIFFSNNKNEDAIKYFTLAAQIKADWSAPYLKLGYVYLNLGDMTKAKENFNKFVAMDPEHPEAPTIKELVQSI